MKQNKLAASLLALDSLSIYRGLLEDEIVSTLRALLIELDTRYFELRKSVNLYNDFYFKLAKSGSLSLTDYIINKIIFDENPFTLKIQTLLNSSPDDALEKAVANDLRNLQQIATLDSVTVKAALFELYKNQSYSQILKELPDWAINSPTLSSINHLKQLQEKFLTNRHWDECLEDLKKFHQNYGCGIYARYSAFIWERIDGQGFIKGIDNPDPITLNDLIDYQDERSKVIDNTLQFLNGFPANNVLLYGDRGTGKSSTVKAILNEYYTQGLRMVEIPKAYLADFPLIIRQLKDRPQKFILFIDDLVFGDNEENYTSLKAILEGGLESRTSNILIYATSNRRHLVKEYFSERAGLQSGNQNEEVHARDSMQEKLSLADRFGLSVIYSSPDQPQYLKIVKGIASRRNLKIDQNKLQREALQWALRYNGRSARTARQFVDWIEGHKAINKL